jgi:hypothetical protein
MYNSAAFTGDLTISEIGFTALINTGFDLDEYIGDLLISKSRFEGNDENGIELSDATGTIEILETDIFDMGNKGIRLQNVENVLIKKVEIDGGGGSQKDGIFAINVQDIEIHESKIRDVGSLPQDDGIDLKDASGTVVIRKNSISGVGDDGIQIENNGTQASVTIVENKEKENIVGGGIELRLKGLEDGPGSIVSAIIRGNELEQLNDHGLEVSVRDNSTLDAEISDNEIEKTDIESAVHFDTRDNAFAKIVFEENKVKKTKGDGIQVVAEDSSTIDVGLIHNEVKEIGDGSGDDGILIQSHSSAEATIRAVVYRNKVEEVAGNGLYVRGQGDTTHHLAIIDNEFRKTNLHSGNAAVLIDDEQSGDATTIHLLLEDNEVKDNKGVDAYQLNQQGSGVFNIIGNEATAEKVVEKNNKGKPITINGTINVESLPDDAWWDQVWEDYH